MNRQAVRSVLCDISVKVRNDYPQELDLDQWTVLVPWGWTGCFLVLAHFVWSCAKIRRRNEFSAGNEVKITSCHSVVATLKEVGIPMPYLF